MLLLVNIYLIISQWIQLVQVFWGKQVLDMTQGINMDAPVSELNFTVKLELTWQHFLIAVLAFIMPEHK